MRSIVEGHRVAQYLAEKLGFERFAEPYVAIGVEENGQVLGGVMFTGYDGRNVDITGCGKPGFLSIAFLRRLSHYVWVELGCARCSFVTANEHAESIVRRLGAVAEGPAFEWFGDGIDGRRYAIHLRNWTFR